MNRLFGFLIGFILLGIMTACDDENNQSTMEQVIVSLGSREFKTLENMTPFQIPVVLSTPTTQQVIVIGYIKSETNAKEGIDYTFVSKQVIIPAGKSIGYFNVEIKDNPSYTPDRSFEFEIVGVEGGHLSALDKCKVTIVSNEGIPVIGFGQTMFSVSEETPVLDVKVKINKPWNEPISFHLETLPEISTAIYGEHYVVDTTQVYTIIPGDTVVSIPVTIIDNLQENEDRYFELNICRVENANLSEAIRTMKITILDDEEPVYICFDKKALKVIESKGEVWVPVRVKGNPKQDIKVMLDVRSGDALENRDYIFTDRELTFPVGIKVDSIKIKLIDNEEYNMDRILNIGFQAVEGALLASADTLIKITITNDDFQLEQLYEDLMGSWTYTNKGGGNGAAAGKVTITGGKNPEEEDANYLKYLIVTFEELGQSSYACTFRMSYDVSTGGLQVVMGDNLMKPITFGDGILSNIRFTHVDGSLAPVDIIHSKDYKTLSWDPDVTVRASLFKVSDNSLWSYWFALKNVVMTKVDEE